MVEEASLKHPGALVALKHSLRKARRKNKDKTKD
jgi:hypothetical protein